MVFIIACALVCEVISLAIFRTYEKDLACCLASSLYLSLTLPVLYIYYNFFYIVTGDEKGAVSIFIGNNNVWVIIGMSAAVVAVTCLGSFIGWLIGKELRKAGKI